MNVVTIKITSCNECPHHGLDINKTRAYCNYFRNAGISCSSNILYWIGDDEEIDCPIPNWCPLLFLNIIERESE